MTEAFVLWNKNWAIGGSWMSRVPLLSTACLTANIVFPHAIRVQPSLRPGHVPEPGDGRPLGAGRTARCSRGIIARRREPVMTVPSSPDGAREATRLGTVA